MSDVTHSVIDILGSGALLLASLAWKQNRTWRARMEKKMQACVLGVNYLLADNENAPEYVKKVLEDAIREE